MTKRILELYDALGLEKGSLANTELTDDTTSSAPVHRVNSAYFINALEKISGNIVGDPQEKAIIQETFMEIIDELRKKIDSNACVTDTYIIRHALFEEASRRIAAKTDQERRKFIFTLKILWQLLMKLPKIVPIV